MGKNQESQLRSINNYTLLSQEQYQQIAYDWNKTEKNYPKDKTIHQLFEEQAERTPNNVAVIFEEKQLTYKELNEQSNQLAHYLRERGVQPDTLVAIACERSLEMIVGILGILKAGGAYVPIDSSYPQERIQFMLEDTKAPFFLTKHAFFEGLQAATAEVFLLDKDKEKLTNYPTTNPPCITRSRHLAYIIYTSGSTGKPKGVMIQHQGLVHSTYARILYYKRPVTRFLLLSSVAFDSSVAGIFWTLIQGGALVLLPQEETFNLHKIHSTIQTFQISHLLCIASFYLLLLDLTKKNELKTLETVIVAGEKIPEHLPQKHVDRQPITSLFDEYGPTEATVWSTVECLYSAYSKEIKPISIGCPISNVQIYVLDTSLNLVPIGVPGELYIGGDGLARGYLNHPKLTAEKFIQNPFQTEEENKQGKNTRLYKTGDLCRRLESGNIEYIGRVDFQVKIRGFRVELGEIEASLLRYPHVKEAVVIAREDSSQNKRLVAYLVFKERTKNKKDNKNKINIHNSVHTEEIRIYLQAILPDYMIPAAFVILERMPLTSNGKVDRKALPAPKFISNEVYLAPRNELETSMCQIWAEVLGLPEDKVGIRDDFFSLGGDSILSIKLFNKIKQKLFLNLSFKDIFSYKTIENIYDNILSKNLQNNNIQIRTEQGTLSGTVDLLPIQEWFFENNFKNAQHWNQSFLLRTPELDIDKLKISLKQLIQHHDAFRLKYKNNKNNQIVQYYDSSFEVEELKILDIGTLKINKDSKEFEETLQNTLSDWQSHFDVEHGPLYSIGYIYGYEDGSSRLYFALHHLIVDAVGWRILAEDLKALYEGKKIESKGSSYRQWVSAVKEYGAKHKEEKSYWQSILADFNVKQLNELVINDTLSYSSFGLTEEKTQKLLKESNKIYNTQINDLLLTALGYTLSEITGDKVNHVMLEGHGREEIDRSIDITRTLGWFTTMYPVRLQVEEELEDSIQYMKENLRRIPNKGIGYGALFGYKIEKLPKIIFNYLGQFEGESADQEHWNITSEKSGIAIHLSNDDYNIININGLAIDGKLQFYITSKLSKVLTNKLTKLFEQKLTEIIDYTTAQTRSHFTENVIHKIPENQENYMTSFFQQEYWSSERKNPKSYAHNIPIFLKLIDSIDSDVFFKSVKLIIERNEVLRTLIIENNQEDLAQKILPTQDVNYSKIFKTIIVHNKAELDANIEQEVSQAFDPASEPPVRVVLYKLQSKLD